MTFGRRLSNTPQSQCDYEVELDFKSGLNESLRYTKRGYRRTDDEIRGIMKAKQKKKTAKQAKLKLDRKIRDKAKTLMLKRLRGSGFEELNEGDYFRSLECDVLDDVLSSSPVTQGKTEKQMRREQHQLVLEANKRNKEMKKARRLIKRFPVQLHLIRQGGCANYLANEYNPVRSEAEDTYMCCSTTPDDELKQALSSDTKFIQFVNPIDSYVQQTLRYHGFDLVENGLWKNKFADDFVVDETSVPRVREEVINTNLSDDVSVPLLAREDTISQRVESKFDEQNWCNENYDEEAKEYEKLYSEFQASSMDVDMKAETLSIEPNPLDEGRVEFNRYASTGIMKWLHSKSADKYTLECVDMVVSLIDMLWLVHTERGYKRRIGIVHLWLGTLGLQVEVKWACSAMSAVIIKLVSETPEVVSESWSSSLESALSFAKKIHNTAFVTAVRDFFVSVAALKMFDKNIALNIYHYMGKPKESNITELSFLAVESLARVLRVAELLYAGVPLSKALFTENPTETAKSTAKTLLAYQNNLYTGLPVEGKMCQREWIIAAKQVLPILENIVKTSNPFKSGYRDVQSMHIDLTLAYSTIRGQIAGSSRVPPFCIVLHGDPGIGKSTIMNFLFRIHSDVKKRLFDESHVFHRIVSSDYWENYDGFSQPYIHYSELGNKNAQLVRTQGDECISELTSVIDSLPMPLNMAFGDKGKSFFLGEMIVIDTNNPGMNLDLLFSNPSAFRRRFIYLQPTVLPEFRKDGSCGIDYEKSKDRRLIDKYSFNCYVKKEVNTKESETVDLVKGGNVDQLYDKLYSLMRERIEMETALLAMKKDDVNTVYGTIVPESKENVYDDDSACYFSNGKWVKGNPPAVQMEEKEIPARHLRPRRNDLSDLPNPYAESVWVPDVHSVNSVLRPAPRPIIAPIQPCRSGKTVFLKRLAQEFVGLCSAAFDLGISKGILHVRPNYMTEDVEFYVDCAAYLLVAWSIMRFFTSVWFYTVFIYCVLALRSTVANEVRAHLVKKVMCKKESRVLEKISNLKVSLSGGNLEQFTPYIYRGFCALAATGSLLVLAKLIYECFIKKHSEDSTEFKVDSDSNSALNRNEEMIGSAFSQKRIAGRVPETWVIRTLHHPISATGTIDQLSEACNSNLRFCVITSKDRVTKVCIFGVCNNFAIMPTHAIPSTDFTVSVSTTPFAGSNCYKISKINRDLMVDLGNDMTLISLSQLQFRDVLKHFNTIDFSVLEGKISDTKVIIKEMKKLLVSNPRGNYYVDKACSYKWGDHKVGLCGMPVYGKVNGGPFIVAMHCAGKLGTADAYAALFDVEKLNMGVKTLLSKCTLMAPVSQSDYDIKFQDPGFKSPFRFQNIHNVEYLGSDGKAIIMPKDSVLTKSKIHCEVDSLFSKIGVEIKEVYAPPLMRPKFVGDEYVSPQGLNLAKINTSKKPLDRTVLADCVEHFVSRVISDLKEQGVDHLSPLPLQEAINGAADDAYLRRINVATGAGYGFKGKKRAHLPIVDEEKELIREPTDGLKQRILIRQEQYLAGQSSGVIFGAKLKDEPRALAKVLKGKTRMFYPAPLDYLIMSRQVLAPIFTLMVQYRNIFNMSVGINMFAEGGAFFEYLSEFADTEDCVFDGDYGGFDTSMPYDIGLAASTVIIELAKRLGYNEHALALVRGVMSDSLFPIIELNSDVFKVAGLMTSGGYGTAEFNCVRNNMLMLYYFATTKGLSLSDYDQNFRKTTYGDDVTGVVKKSIQHLFNNVLYAKYCEDVLGMEFTSPDKTVNDVPLRKLSQLSFLKRNFVVHPQFGTVMAVLDYESIAKSLKWYIPSEALSQIDQVIATANSALWEMFMHVDRNTFDEFRADLIKKISEAYSVELESKDFSASWVRICKVLCPNAMELREEEALSSTDGVIELTLCDVDGMSDF